jgi:hypothetical protein
VAIYKFTKDALVPLTETQLSAENILERKDLQRLLRTQIQALDADLMVISEEFGQWVESTRRIDLLCIDKDATLVVVELKRTDDGGHMELQAIRYAAMISAMTFSQLVDTHKHYLEKLGQASDAAERNILKFLAWDRPDDDAFAKEVRIVLAAADFSKELTTAMAVSFSTFNSLSHCPRQATIRHKSKPKNRPAASSERSDMICASASGLNCSNMRAHEPTFMRAGVRESTIGSVALSGGTASI